MFNYRHPGPRRVWKGELDLPPRLFPVDSWDPLDPVDPGDALDLVQRIHRLGAPHTKQAENSSFEVDPTRNRQRIHRFRWALHETSREFIV